MGTLPGNRKRPRGRSAGTRKKIVDATLAIAAKKGFEHATTAEIAKRAGVAEGSIYHYFRTKDDLLIHTVREYSGSFLSALSQAIADEADPLRKIDRLISFHIRFFTQEGNIFQVIYGKRPGAKLQMARIIRVAIAPYASLIENIIREGIERGMIEEVNPEIAASFLLGGMQITLLRRFFDLADYDPGEAAEQIRAIYFNGLSKKKVRTPAGGRRPAKGKKARARRRQGA